MRSRDELAEEFAIQATGTDIHTSHLQGCAENIIAWGYQLADALIARRSPPPAASEPTPVASEDPRRVVGAVVKCPDVLSGIPHYIVVNDGSTGNSTQRLLSGDAQDSKYCDSPNDMFVRWATPDECARHGIPYVDRSKPVASEARTKFVRVLGDFVPPNAKGSIVPVIAWHGNFAEVRGIDNTTIDLCPDEWEPADAPTPAATTTEEDPCGRAIEYCHSVNLDVAEDPRRFYAARDGYMAGLAAARKETA